MNGQNNVQNVKFDGIDFSQNDVLLNTNVQELTELQKKIQYLKEYPMLFKVETSKILNPYYTFEYLKKWDKITTYSALRQRLTASIIFFLGLRESEFTLLKPSDFSFANKSVNIITLKRKRKTVKTLPLEHIPNSELAIWEKYIYLKRLFNVKRETIYHRLCAFFGKKVNPHALRHSFGFFLYETTKDIRLVQEMLRHKNIANTSIYTRIINEELRNKLKKLLE